MYGVCGVLYDVFDLGVIGSCLTRFLGCRELFESFFDEDVDRWRRTCYKY